LKWNEYIETMCRFLRACEMLDVNTFWRSRKYGRAARMLCFSSQMCRMKASYTFTPFGCDINPSRNCVSNPINASYWRFCSSYREPFGLP
jgi:hypothetical protein